MKMLLGAIAAAALITTGVPALAQNDTSNGPANGVTTNGQPMRQHEPGTGGTSKPGVPGLPGSKAGKTVKPSGMSGSSEPPHNTQLQDQSQVPGKPGGKAGPATGSQKNEEGAGSGNSTSTGR